MRISDEQLDHYADLYQRLQVKEYGVAFHIFIQHPQAIIDWIESPDARPLLLKQRLAIQEARANEDNAMRSAANAVCRQLARAIEDAQQAHESALDRRAVCRNGSFIEPLHHHAHPRSPRSV